MEPADLRSHIKRLEQDGELLRVERAVDPRYELANVAMKAEKSRGCAVFFQNVKGYKIPVVCGIMSGIDRIAKSLNTTRNDIVEVISKAMENPIQPQLVGKGPIMENYRDSEIDLTHMFPIPTHSNVDAGPFISAGIVVAKDPKTGRRNLSYNRLQVKGPNKLGINIARWRHLLEYYDESKSTNKPLDVAVCIGVSPFLEMAASARVPFDEFELAGALQGESVSLVKCRRVDLEVPATAEIVLEGEILPNVIEDEGPFGEFHGYSSSGKHPVMRVKGVLFRDEPIYRTIVGCSSEHVLLGNVVSRDPLLYKFVKHVTPSVKAVHHPPHCAGFLAVISIKKRIEGEAKNVIAAALASHVNVKIVIVVDEDVDVFDPKDVMWAISTRMEEPGNLVVMPGAMGYKIGVPGKYQSSVKVGIDATVPLDGTGRFKRVTWDIDKINLDEYTKSSGKRER